jgi:hypothetical protein
METVTENNVFIAAPKAPKKWTGLIAFSLNRAQFAKAEAKLGSDKVQLRIKEFVVKELGLNEEAKQA